MFTSILLGAFIWRFFYVPFHHKMPWVKKEITIKRNKRGWE